MVEPADQQAAGDTAAVEQWLARLGARLPPGTLDEVGSAEQVVLLDLARIAARRSHRTAAPITTYLVGLAFASLPKAERLAAIRDVTTSLEDGGS